MAKITPARRKLNAIARAVKELGEQGYFVSRCLEELRETFDLYADPRLQDPDIDVEIFIRIEVGVGSETLDAVKRIENFKTKRESCGSSQKNPESSMILEDSFISSSTKRGLYKVRLRSS